jgi:hypothetical protein
MRSSKTRVGMDFLTNVRSLDSELITLHPLFSYLAIFSI